MASQSVVAQFNKWGLEPSLFYTQHLINWPDAQSGFGTVFNQVGSVVPLGPTKYPITTGVFSPHNILKPSKTMVNVQAYVWWGVDISTLGLPVFTKTNVMFGAQVSTISSGGPTFTNFTAIPFYSNGFGVGFPDIYEDATGQVPVSRVPAAIAGSGYPLDPANTLSNMQLFTNAVIPQVAVSMRTFQPGQTICGMYRDPLYFIYKDNNGNVQFDTSVTFKNFQNYVPAVSVSAGIGGVIELTSLGSQAAGNPLQLWRLSAGLPATGYFASGFDLDKDGVKEVDNFAAPVNVFGIELYIS